MAEYHKSPSQQLGAAQSEFALVNGDDEEAGYAQDPPKPLPDLIDFNASDIVRAFDFRKTPWRILVGVFVLFALFVPVQIVLSVAYLSTERHVLITWLECAGLWMVASCLFVASLFFYPMDDRHVPWVLLVLHGALQMLWIHGTVIIVSVPETYQRADYMVWTFGEVYTLLSWLSTAVNISFRYGQTMRDSLHRFVSSQ